MQTMLVLKVATKLSCISLRGKLLQRRTNLASYLFTTILTLYFFDQGALYLKQGATSSFTQKFGRESRRKREAVKEFVQRAQHITK